MKNYHDMVKILRSGYKVGNRKTLNAIGGINKPIYDKIYRLIDEKYKGNNFFFFKILWKTSETLKEEDINKSIYRF